MELNDSLATWLDQLKIGKILAVAKCVNIFSFKFSSCTISNAGYLVLSLQVTALCSRKVLNGLLMCCIIFIINGC